MNKQLAGRDYVMGRGILNTEGRVRILVVDVHQDAVISEHQKAHEATEAMIRYAKANKIETLMAIASDFGPDQPLIVTETY